MQNPNHMIFAKVVPHASEVKIRRSQQGLPSLTWRGGLR
jgi:hypothetical protein